MSKFSVICVAVAVHGWLGLSAGLAQVNVLTQHNDNFRTGQNTSETTLAPSNVNSGTFGKLFSQPVDGAIYAQPLYMSQVNIPNLGGYNPNSNNNLQTLYMAVGGIYGAPAYWNSTVYFWGVRDYLKAFGITGGTLSTAPVDSGSVVIDHPSTTPSVSANGNTNGIVWGIDASAYGTNGAAVLSAFDAADLGNEVYDSNQNLGRDNPGGAVQLTVPTIRTAKHTPKIV
jgi:hypothetical protein